MHTKIIISAAALAFSALGTALSSYIVTNQCDDKKYLTLSSNDNGVLALNAELPGGTSRTYYIDSQHSLAIANTTDYWNANTYKLVLGTNTVSNVLYYAIGTANGNPLVNKSFTFASQQPEQCPSITTADGLTKGCSDNKVVFNFPLCS